MARRSKSWDFRLRRGWTRWKRSLNWRQRLSKIWIKRRRIGSKTVPSGSSSGRRYSKRFNRAKRNWREGKKRLLVWNKSWSELTKNSMGPKDHYKLSLSYYSAKLRSSNRHSQRWWKQCSPSKMSLRRRKARSVPCLGWLRCMLRRRALWSLLMTSWLRVTSSCCSRCTHSSLMRLCWLMSNAYRWNWSRRCMMRRRHRLITTTSNKLRSLLISIIK